MKATCLGCGKDKSPNGKYCKSCGYKHRRRPSGLKYVKHKENPTSFKKGMIPWSKLNPNKCKPNKGSFKKGEHISPKTEFKKETTAKEKNVNWKGGITPINEQIRHSEEYKLWRDAVFKRDNYTCIWCGKIGGILHADHIKLFSLFPELRFAIDNGRTLCKECHIKRHKNEGQ